MFYRKINNIKQAKKDLGSLTELEFTGTVKVHGTNAGIVMEPGKEPVFLSRSRVLSMQSDNAGFYEYMHDKVHADPVLKYTIYGEWCGGNIQKGVAVSGMPKTFIIFEVITEDGRYLDPAKVAFSHFKEGTRVFGINQFTTFKLHGTLADLEPKMEELTLLVEQDCPVGARLNSNSTCKIGEGIVWQVGSYKFKTKGDAHKRKSTNGKTLRVAQVSTMPVELRDKVQEAIKAWVNVDRLEQGKEVLLEKGFTTEPKDFGNFLKWLHADILAEEDVSEILALHEDITWNRLAKEITAIAKDYYL